MSTNPTTKQLQQAIHQHINQRQTALTEEIKQVQEELEDLAYVDQQRERLDIHKSHFHIRIDERSSMAYSNREEELQYSGIGLQATVERAERQFVQRYGKIRTDGWVTYYVSVTIGGQQMPVPPKLWVGFTCQTLKSLQAADNK